MPAWPGCLGRGPAAAWTGVVGGGLPASQSPGARLRAVSDQGSARPGRSISARPSESIHPSVRVNPSDSDRRTQAGTLQVCTLVIVRCTSHESSLPVGHGSQLPGHRDGHGPGPVRVRVTFSSLREPGPGVCRAAVTVAAACRRQSPSASLRLGPAEPRSSAGGPSDLQGSKTRRPAAPGPARAAAGREGGPPPKLATRLC